MKLKAIALSIVLVTLFSSFASAQATESPRIKVLPTAKPGVILVIYAMETTKPVEVNFRTDNGLVGSDKIKGYYPKGVSKKYDVSHIDNNEYWIEVSSLGVSAMYHIVPSNDNKKFTAYLQKSFIDLDMIAKNY